MAIILQGLFFVILHATSYAAGWYQAPTWLGAFTIISAVQGSLIAAGIFALISGYFVSRDGVKNITISIVAHFVINSILFAQFAVVGLNIGGL